MGVLLLSSIGSAAPPDFSSLAALIESECRRLRVPGCAVGVVVDGEIAFARGFGVASVATGGEITGDTLFRIGSTTKMFTAAGLVLLAEQGKLRLDAPIGTYTQGLHPALARLTPHQLLTHTSGLADPNALTGPHDDTALAARVRTLGPGDFFDEPGRIYSYSNIGYWIAGFVTQEVGGRPFADQLHETLFRPLGMERSTFRPTAAMTWPLAVGHAAEGDGPPAVVRPLADNAAAWPAGQLFTSAREFARFCIAFMNAGRIDGRPILPPSLITLLSSPQVPQPNSDRHYGFGLGVQTESGLRWLSHGGSRTGYGSQVRMCPEKNFAVVILCNRTGASLPKVAERAAQLVLGVSPPEPPAKQNLAMSPAELARFAGRYSNGRNQIALRVGDGRLFAAQGGEVRRTGPHTFTRAASGSTPALNFSLVSGPDGRVTHLHSLGRAWKRLD